MIAMLIMERLHVFGADFWSAPVDSGGIANFQTVFNLITAILLVPFAGALVKLATWILRDRHTKRLKSGACSVDTGLVFMETLTYLERASDQCSSIAVMMMARDNEAILQNHYEYLREVHSGNDAVYASEKERRRQQYIKPLNEIS